MSTDDTGPQRSQPHISDFLTLEKDELLSFILSQQIDQRRIQNEARQKYQFIITIVLGVGSLGVIKYIFAPNVWDTSWDVPDEWFSRCLPSSLTADGVSIEGVGIFNFFLILGFLLLVIILLAEIWYFNSKIQEVPAIQPPFESRRFLASAVENQVRLDYSKTLLNQVDFKIEGSLYLVFIAALIIVMSFLNQALSLLISDFLLVIGGLALVVIWLWKTIGTDGQTKIRMFRVAGYGFDLSMLAFIYVETFAIILLWQHWLLIERFLIC